MRRIKYYYGREPITNHPKVTVCLIHGQGERQDSVFSRGVSICSDSEKTLSKQKGRNMAFGRAQKAFVNGKSSMPITRDEAWHVLSKCGVLIGEHKSEYGVAVTGFEKRLFEEDQN